MRERIPAWATVASGLMVAALIGAVAELLREAGSGATDHLWVIGDIVKWRWTSLTVFAVLLLLSVSAWISATRDVFDPTGSHLEPADEPFVLISDGVAWRYQGVRKWQATGHEELDVAPLCEKHRVPLLSWNKSYKRPESILRAYGQNKARCRLYCPGLATGEGHEVVLTEYITLDAARRVAIARVQRKLHGA